MDNYKFISPIIDQDKLRQMSEFALSHAQVKAPLKKYFWQFIFAPKFALIASIVILLGIGSWVFIPSQETEHNSDIDITDMMLYHTLDDLAS